MGQRTVLFELAHDVGNRRGLLADRDVNTFDAGGLLIDDRVDRHRSLAGLTIADDQLTLAAADRDHRVDRLEAGLHRLVDGLARDDAGRDFLDRRGAGGSDRALAIDRTAERIDDAAKQRFADRHFENAAGGLHRVAFLQMLVVAKHDGADRVALEIQREAESGFASRAGEFQHFALQGIAQAVDADDAVLQRDDGAGVPGLGRRFKILDAGLDEIADFGRIQLHVYAFVTWTERASAPLINS